MGRNSYLLKRLDMKGKAMEKKLFDILRNNFVFL